MPDNLIETHLYFWNQIKKTNSEFQCKIRFHIKRLDIKPDLLMKNINVYIMIEPKYLLISV